MTFEIYFTEMTNKENKPTLLIVGLGNPSQEFEGTYHNIGREILFLLCKEEGGSFKFSKKVSGLVAHLKIGEREIIFLLPETFMNRSGLSVIQSLKYWKIASRNMLVVQDDSDMALGKTKIVFGKSSGGHRGIGSIIQSINNQDFARLKIGVRPSFLPQGGQRHVKAEKFILRPFSKEKFGKILADSKTIVRSWIEEGLVSTMNRYN